MLGLDCLGGVNYAGAIVDGLSSGRCVGLMWDPFGNIIKTATILAESKKFPAIRVQGRYDSNHRFPKQIWKSLAQKCYEVNKVALKYKNVQFLYSPACEHNLSLPDIQSLMILCKKEITAKNLQLVNSILKGSRLVGIVDEVHGKSPKRPDNEFYSVSADGIGGKGEGNWPDINVPDWITRYGSASFIFGWDFILNGKVDWEDKTDVNKRTHWPDADDIRALDSQLEPREGPEPKIPDMLWKPIAEDNGKGDAKSRKALAIVPHRLDEVVVKTHRGGHVVERMQIAKRDPYFKGKPSGYRYYSNEEAFKLAARAKKLSGSKLVSVHANKSAYGPFDVTHRSGFFK